MSSLLQIRGGFGGPPDRGKIYCLRYGAVVFWKMACFPERCLIHRDTHHFNIRSDLMPFGDTYGFQLMINAGGLGSAISRRSGTEWSIDKK